MRPLRKNNQTRQNTNMENRTPEIETVPDGYIWCEHCGYNRSLTTDQLKDLSDDVVETWCPECDEAMLNHGTECPDHIHLDLPLLPYQDDEPQKMAPRESDRLERWRAQGVERPAIYRVERRHRYLPDKWQSVGEFVAGSPWRDERPVNDETMREELIGYERTWIKYEARVIRPDGTILQHNH